MAWFDFNRSAADEAEGDMALDALRALLEQWSESVPDGRRSRLDRLRKRLERPPIPTGLNRELIAIWTEIQPKKTGHSPQGTQHVTDLAKALTQAMRVSSLLDNDLQQRIAALSSAIPRSVGPGDARRLILESKAVRRLAIPARDRQKEERSQLAGMVRDLGTALKDASDASTSIGGGVAALSKQLATEPDPRRLAEIRVNLVETVRMLSSDMKSLKKELRRADGRTRKLQNLVQQQARLLLDLRDEASLDPLTRLVHRGTFDAALKDRVTRAKDAEKPLALLLLDIDHFKRVNDEHGHSVGDEVLMTTAKILQNQVRDGDIVGRVGGEEFAILLPGAPSEVAMAVSERIRNRISSLTPRGEEETPLPSITLSIGVALLREEDTGKDLYERADQALYAAKNEGRNRVVLEQN